MKKVISVLLCCLIFLTACSQNGSLTVNSSQNMETRQPSENTKEDSFTTSKIEYDRQNEDIVFNNLNDDGLIQYVKDSIYSDLEAGFSSDDYIIDNIEATYVSKEYLDEIAYNSQSNIYFGYTLKELDEQFKGTRYIFTLGDNGQTTVKAFECYDDTYDKVVKNVAIGSGVILVCVTVSIITGGIGLNAVSVVFAASAKTGTKFALSSGVFSGVVHGVINGIQTKDFKEALKAATLYGSEGFKWGAITGAVSGGLTKILTTNKAIPSPSESELRALKKYGGVKQKSYLGGKEVPFGTPDSTRPDISCVTNSKLDAIEVKNYDLNSTYSRSELYQVVKNEIADRVKNLPKDSTQRVVLDVKGRNYSQELINKVIQKIQEHCNDVYPNLPVDIMGG